MRRLDVRARWRRFEHNGNRFYGLHIIRTVLRNARVQVQLHPNLAFASQEVQVHLQADRFRRHFEFLVRAPENKRLFVVGDRELQELLAWSI